MGLAGCLSAVLAGAAGYRLLVRSRVPGRTGPILGGIFAAVLVCSGLGSLPVLSSGIAEAPALVPLLLAAQAAAVAVPALFPLVAAAFVLQPAAGSRGNRGAHLFLAFLVVAAVAVVGSRAWWEAALWRGPGDEPAPALPALASDAAVLAALLCALIAAALSWSMSDGSGVRREGPDAETTSASPFRRAVMFAYLWATMALMQVLAFGIAYPDGLGIGGTLLVTALVFVWPVCAVAVVPVVLVTRRRNPSGADQGRRTRSACWTRTKISG